jgi:hypothetical protein
VEEARWLEGLIPEGLLPRITLRTGPLCLSCRGRGFCGRGGCPALVRAQSLARVNRLLTSSVVQGSSPPAFFVGRIGYPKVWVGPMVPPLRGQTEVLDTPELWMGKPLGEILDYRFSLVRGKVRKEVYSQDRFISSLQELALSSRPVDSEMVLSRVPRSTLIFSEEVQPFGPSAPLRSFTAQPSGTDRRLEKAFYDRDLKAVQAVHQLYGEGVPVSRIQRAFSLGMLGIGRQRRLVPTRWSITAVDSILSERLVEKVRGFETIDEYRVYHFRHLHNTFAVLMIPDCWSFEWAEAWYPGTAWNPGREREVISDCEGYWGRKTYPEIGGCYYACRLAVAEKLAGEGRQATVVALREIHPGFLLPLGVWFVREGIREALRREAQKFGTLQEALAHLSSLLEVPLPHWLSSCGLLRRVRGQKKLGEFL